MNLGNARPNVKNGKQHCKYTLSTQVFAAINTYEDVLQQARSVGLHKQHYRGQAKPSLITSSYPQLQSIQLFKPFLIQNVYVALIPQPRPSKTRRDW